MYAPDTTRSADSDWSWVEHWTDLLDQGEVWRDAAGVIHRIDEMDPGYCARVHAFCLRNADWALDVFAYEMTLGPGPSGDVATDCFNRAFDELGAAGSDPRAWMEQAPLLAALRERARVAVPAPAPEEQGEENPFGPYEYVEPSDRCGGAEGRCAWDRCVQRASQCRCRCARCVQRVDTF